MPNFTMTNDLLAALRADVPPMGGLSADVVDRLAVSCSTASGGWEVAIEVRDRGAAATIHGTSSDRAAQVLDLQFTTGQGPTWDALTTQRPVFAVMDEIGDRWPQLAPLIRARGVFSIVALPLQVGAVVLGTLTLVRDVPTAFDHPLVATLLAVRTALVGVVLTLIAASSESTDEQAKRTAAPTAVVHQATGMVAVQLACDLADALVRLRGHSYQHGIPLHEVAEAVVGGELEFHP